MLTKVFYDWSKLKAPKPDTKTSKNQQVGKRGTWTPNQGSGAVKKSIYEKRLESNFVENMY